MSTMRAAAAFAIITAQSGTQYTADANAIITDVANGDVVSLLNAGCTIPPPDAAVQFDFSPAAGASNVCNVTITPKDAAGNALTGIRNLLIWLSDAATGAGATGTSASGTVQNKSGEGTVLAAIVAKKVISVQTKAGGTFVLEITDAAKTGFYVCAQDPISGLIDVSAQLVTGNYG